MWNYRKCGPFGRVEAVRDKLMMELDNSAWQLSFTLTEVHTILTDP